jgi:hypothetical protein
VNAVAHHCVWIAAGLFLTSLCCWRLRGVLEQPAAVARV